MRLFIAAFICLFFTVSSFGQSETMTEKLKFISPMDDSEFHNINTCIVLRHTSALDIHDLDETCLEVMGSASGQHDFEVLQSGDLKTLNIVFTQDFELDEVVSVSLGDCLTASNGSFIEPVNWSFRTSSRLPAAWSSEEQWEDELDEASIDIDTQENLSAVAFPEINYIVEPNGDVAPGNFFISLKAGQDSEIAITDSLGQTVLWQDNEPLGGRDFKLNRSNYPAYGITAPYGWRVLDEFGEVADFVTMWNGYVIDWHDFQHLENDHKWLFSYDSQVTDMSEIIEGGDPEALVTGFVIQELDEDNVLLMQWRSWDYLDILDNEDNNLTLASVDPFHINSIELDTDENILISMRHVNEILKFDSETGDIIWRWGINEANSQFEFLNDGGFSHQHDLRRLPNGNLMMFDNANVTGQVSRAVEYSMDTVANTVTKVWEYIHPEQIFGSSTGGAQRLANGNSVIYWGNVSIDEYGARFSEVDYEGNVLIEFNYDLQWSSYRLRKAEWMFSEPVIGCMDETAFNFDPEATEDDPELCQYDLDNDGFSPETGDCDDTNSDINPDAVEIPNDGIDQDCSGADAVDFDEDGFFDDVDCDDTNPDINPDAEEIPYDGIDQDCSGADLTDVDEDGFSPEDGDCDDNNPDINPDETEIPYDGIDQDCSGADLTDVDEDGFSPEDGDCDDNNPDINPDEIEIPNDGIDQDCDGEDLITSVEEQDFPFNLNRVGDELFLNDLAAGKWVTRIFDASGKLVRNLDHQGGSFQISMQDLMAGVYLVSITNQESIYSLRVVKD